MPRLSIVVPSYNRRASLLRLLSALERQTVPLSDFEVVVVDDGSTDGTFSALQELQPGYALRVLQQTNAGPAAARTRGVKEAKAELILFLDDDVVPIQELVERHLASHADGDNMVVIGPMQPPSGWARPAWIRWEEEMLEVQYRAMLAGEYPCTPRQFYTANASLSRRRFLESGGFDATFKRAEDVEFAYRLRDAGAEFKFLPQAIVHHYASRTFAAWSRTPYQYGRYDVLMHREKGHEALSCAVEEFHTRHVLTRTLARLCVGRGAFVKTSVVSLRGLALAADGIGLGKVARLALGAIFNLLYWQGVSDEIGGSKQVWSAIALRRVPA